MPDRNNTRRGVGLVAAAAVCATTLLGAPLTAHADASKPVQPASIDPSNDRLSISVSSDGLFTEGAFPDASGGPTAGSYKLMYGWPSTGTSYTTIRLDGTDAHYGDASGAFSQQPVDINATTNDSTWDDGPVRVRQRLQLVTNPDTGRADTAAISYTLTNTDAVSHQVGVRTMIDTDVNDNDGAPFRVPGIGPVTTEQILTGSAIPDTFQVFADLADSAHIAAARLRGAGATAPDRLVIGAWPGLVQAPWDYTTDPTRSITSDSAYAAYWYPAALAPGASRTVTTYYGLSDVSVDLTPPLALGVSGPASLSVSGDVYSPNPFTVTATVSNAGTADATAASLRLNLPPGLRTESTNPVQVGDLTAGGSERQASWQVSVEPSDTARTLTYSVTASAGNATSKTVTRGVTIPAAAPQCSDLYFLGAAGSGQSTSPSAPDHGFGAQVDSAYASLSADLAGRRRVEGHPLPYAAANVWTLLNAPGVYFDSISVGVRAAEAKLELLRSQCPHEHIVLAGYSQGAMVMHRVVRDLVRHDDAGTLTRLDGVLLIADGDRVKADNTTDWGSALAQGQGIGQFMPLISGTSDTKFPSYLEPRIHRICNRLDPVCDDVHLPGINHGVALAATLTPRIPIHLGYSNTAPLLGAVNAVAQEVRTTPAPSPSLGHLSATAGRPYRYQLTADVDPSFSLQWQLVVPSTLPPGWILDPDGTVSGTTSYVGDWTSLVQVRSVILGVTSEWIPATVHWTINPG